MSNDNKLRFLWPALAAINPIISAFLVYFASIGSISVSREASLYKRIELLEAKIEDQNKSLMTAHGEIIRYKAIRSESDTQTILEAYLDSLPGPAWIKEVVTEDGEKVFRMLLINKEYELKYGVSRHYYKGKTDFEVWAHKESAKEFYEADIQIYKLKKSKRYKETFPRNALLPVSQDNPLITRDIWKGAVELPGGRWGVAGLAIDH